MIKVNVIFNYILGKITMAHKIQTVEWLRIALDDISEVCDKI